MKSPIKSPLNANFTNQYVERALFDKDGGKEGEFGNLSSRITLSFIRLCAPRRSNESAAKAIGNRQGGLNMCRFTSHGFRNFATFNFKLN